MTLYWISNPCAISQNNIFSNWNAQGYRKGLITELFFLFFVYFITQLIQSLLYKNKTTSNPEQKALRQSINNQNPNSSTIKKQLPWYPQRWNRQFAMIFSTNCIAVGMCILFSPFAGSMAMAYIHLFLFFGFVICEIKVMIFQGKILRILMDLCNLSLILIGTVSINLNSCRSDFSCKGVDVGVLSQQICFG